MRFDPQRHVNPSTGRCGLDEDESEHDGIFLYLILQLENKIALEDAREENNHVPFKCGIPPNTPPLHTPGPPYSCKRIKNFWTFILPVVVACNERKKEK